MAGDGDALARPVVVRLLAVLAFAAGCLDVLCVARLGGLFSSVITGNLVQLGRGVAGPDGQLIVGAAIAVGAFAVGVAAATVALRRQAPGWRTRTSVVGAVEVLLLAGVAVGWLEGGGHPSAGLAIVLLALASLAMGVQSAVTLSVGVPGASTTYLTGTLATYVGAVVVRPYQVGTRVADVVRLVALLAGAVAGAFLLRYAPLWTPVLPAVLVTIVVALGIRRRSAGVGQVAGAR